MKRYWALYLMLLCYDSFCAGNRFFFASLDSIANNCPCCQLSDIDVLDSNTLSNDFIDILEDCHEYIEDHGVYINYCGNYLDLSGANLVVASKSKVFLELLDYYSEKCFDFIEMLDYPVDLCDENAGVYKNNTVFNYTNWHIQKTRAKFCSEMKEDLDIYKDYDLKWSKNLDLPKFHLDQPGDGAKFRRIAGILTLPTVGGIILSAIALSKVDELNATIIYGGTIIPFFPIVLSIAGGTSSITFLSIAYTKDNNLKKHKRLVNEIRDRPFLGLEFQVEWD